MNLVPVQTFGNQVNPLLAQRHVFKAMKIIKFNPKNKTMKPREISFNLMGYSSRKV